MNDLLIDCPYCGTKISTQASICPKCKHSIPIQNDHQHNVIVDPYAREVYKEIKANNIGKIISSIISLIIAIILLQQCNSCVEEITSNNNKIHNIYTNSDLRGSREYISDYDDKEFVKDEYLENLPYWAPEVLTTKNMTYGSLCFSVPDCLIPDSASNETRSNFTSFDGLMLLTIYKDKHIMNTTTQEQYDLVNDIYAERGDSITYKECYSDRFCISGFTLDNMPYYRYSIIYNEDIYTYIFEWDKSIYEAGRYIIENEMIKFYLDNGDVQSNTNN